MDGVNRRNLVWLVAVVAALVLVGLTLGWWWGVLAAAVVLVASESVERSRRRRRRAARGDDPSAHAVRGAVARKRTR